MTLAHKTELYTCMYAQNPILTIHQAFGAFFSHFLKASAPYFISAISAFIHQKLYDVKCRNLLFMNKMVCAIAKVRKMRYQHQFTAIGYQATVTCLVSVFIVCIFRSIYAPTPDLEPIIERMSKSRDGERQIFICQRVSIYTADNIYTTHKINSIL